MRHFSILAGLFLTIVAGACGKNASQGQAPPPASALRPERARPSEPAPRPEQAVGDSPNPDHEILDLVLTDLVDFDDFDPAVGGRAVKKSQIVLGDATKWVQNDPSEFLPFYGWNTKLPPDLGSRLQKRNLKQYSLREYLPASPNIILRDMNTVSKGFDFEDQFPHARGWVEIRLPGYSEDGQSAVLWFGCGPSAHGSAGVYVLAKANEHWQIKSREVVDFE